VTIGRSPADVLRLVVAASALVVYLVVEALFGSSIAAFFEQLFHGVDALGQSFPSALIAAIRFAATCLVVAGVIMVVRRGRWRLLVTVGVAAGAAALLYALVHGWVHEYHAALITPSPSAGPLTNRGFPTGEGTAALAATATAASPWLVRWQRRASWAVVDAVALALFATQPVSGASLLAVLLGWTAGAAALVGLGSPRRRATAATVLAGLGQVGVHVVDLHPAAVDARGSTPYFGTDRDGQAVFVKVLGRDERSADLLFRLYRAVLPRRLGDERPFSSLRREVEHEAVVALMAGQQGVRTPALLGFATAQPESFVLVYRGIAGRSLDRVAPEELGDAVTAQVWSQIRILRDHRIAHRDLRLANLFLDDDQHVWIIDFGFAELAASDLLLATDLAEAVASLSLKIGTERAARQAVDELGAEAAATAVVRLDPAYLSGATRAGLKDRPQLLPQLRSALPASGRPAGPDRTPGVVALDRD
jgi:undecaprenyl-diphosphatase